MKEWFIHFWTDEAKFIALMRGLLATAGAVATQIDSLPSWVGIFVMALSQFIAAGEKNDNNR